MTHATDLVGMRFDRLTVLARAGRSANGIIKWAVRCDCGREFQTRGDRLKSGKTRSCGRLKKPIGPPRKKAAGRGPRAIPTQERVIWYGIIQRCYNPNSKAFRIYGGRGIQMCPEWRHSFETFLKDVGPRPSPLHSIDRIDNDGDYEPGNVRWTTRREQNRNKQNTRYIEFRGRVMCLADWSEAVGLNASTIGHRLASGWSVERALTTPLRSHKKAVGGAGEGVQP